MQTVQRREPGKTSTGDRATVRLDPGMIQLLETALPGSGISLGAGYHAPLNVPFGIAATAAYALIVPSRDGVSWTGYDVDVRWLAAAGIDDILFADAEVTAIDAGMACFEISARTGGGRQLLTGVLRLRAVKDGRPVGSTRPSLEKPRERIDGHSLLTWIEAPKAMKLGHTAALSIELSNNNCQEVEVTVTVRLPPGAGLSLEGGAGPRAMAIAANSAQTLSMALRADRPDEVNLGRPWRVEVIAKAGEIEESRQIDISVADPRPGRIYYVLNEDCETFDGGPLTGNYGASSVLGNANNWMDPEDYRIQMIEKPARLNEIADRYGARWTHFWCVPQRFAVDWASRHSSTGAWPRLGAALDDSIRQGSERHEYAPHIHFDYEPDSLLPPQPRLLYDEATDGILPNEYYDPITNPRHHYHDWDGSGRGISYIKRLGDLNELDSKAGSLHKCLLYLARLTANRRYPLIARTGGFDFGVTAEDQEISTAAYEMNGFRGNADARLVERQSPRGRQIYWCDAGNRLHEVEQISQARLVQLADTFETDFSDWDGVNRWFAAGVERSGRCGIHVLASMAHAMFMRGEPDAFRSLEGGSFAGLDRHLAWVRENYPEVEFATATEALVEYLDYYAPALQAYVAPVLCGGNPEAGFYEFSVRLLGRGIRVDELYPAEIQIRVPPLFRAPELESLRVTSGGDVLAEETAFDAGRQPSVTVTLTRRVEDMRLEVRVRPQAVASLACWFSAARYAEPPEAARPPLFAWAAPGEGRFPTDLLRLLMNPVAGGTEPLGRRIHPLGVFVMGAAISAAVEFEGESRQPVRLQLRWRRAVSLSDSEVRTNCAKIDQSRFEVRVTDPSGGLCAEAVVELSAGFPA